MKPKFIFLILVFYSFGFVLHSNPVIKKDSLNKSHRFFITTYPSTIFTGDISLGGEHSFKRFRQELAVFYKTYNVLKNFKFDKGYRVDYYLKFNFINRENHKMSLDLGCIYQERSYLNKVVPFPRQAFLEPPPASMISRYRSDKKEVIYGFGLGVSSLSKLYRNFFWGMSLDLFVTRLTRKYSAKEYVSGPVVITDEKLIIQEPIALPYTEKYTWKRRYYLTGFIKIAYCLN